MSADVRLQVAGVTHRYGTVIALEDVVLDVPEHELITLLGPSGCGKTTLLRIIAGFIRPTQGKVLLEGRDVTRVPPHKRPVNMVFQRATLFPHLDVFENVAFGLRIAHVPKAEVTSHVQDALRLVRLDGYERRRAYELSGGQMQRVALARALVNKPRVLLLDEPLSALDLKIRLEMEEELRRVHRETGATFVYVTHDQREALALSDRIAVFDQGRIQQIGSPEDVYRRPTSPFAARFVGDANVLPCTVEAAAGDAVNVVLAGARLLVGSQGTDPGQAWLVIRAEAIGVGPTDGAVLTGNVRDVAFRGTGYSYRVDVPGLADPVRAEVGGGADAFSIGDEVGLHWDSQRGRLLPRSE